MTDVGEEIKRMEEEEKKAQEAQKEDMVKFMMFGSGVNTPKMSSEGVSNEQ